jgi:hypothetical protein
MTIDKMRQEIKLRWNKINSNHKKDLPDAYLDDIINNAINDYVEIFYSGNNFKRYKFGFEVTQQRIDMLSTLVVPHKLIAPTLVSPQIYKFDLSTLSPSYKHLLRGHVIATNCNNRKIKIDLIRHNDYDHKIIDDNTKPSLTWRRCLGLIKSDGSVGSSLYLYTDENFAATSVEIEYIRKPRKVFSSNYNSLEYINGDLTAYNNTDSKVDCDLPEDYHTLVVDMTVQLIAGILEDNNKYQIIEEKLLKTT